MKKKSFYLATFLLVLLFQSCSKRTEVIRKISGAWSIVELSKDGTLIPLSGQVNSVYFEKCPGTKTGCNVDITVNGTERRFEYTMNDQGTGFTAIPYDSSDDLLNFDIEKMDKDQVVLTVNEDDKLMRYTLVGRL